MLIINTVENEVQTTLILEGRLDAESVKDLKEALSGISENVTDIEIDLEKVASVSSAGLRVFLQLHNQLNQGGGRLTISHPQEVVREVLENTGLMNCLNIVI